MSLFGFLKEVVGAHLYLYDLNTGELKHSITQGDWVVREILHVDPETAKGDI